MPVWTDKVEEPFRGDDAFWRAVGLSVDAAVALMAAFVLAGFVGGWARVAFVVPASLMVASAWAGRTASNNARLVLAGRAEWRDAERRAVAAAIPGAFTRHLRRRPPGAASQG